MSLFDKLHGVVHQLGTDIKEHISNQAEVHGHTHNSGQCSVGSHASEHRFCSFAPQRTGNDVKWFVDGCSYMWAVSRALENARESIWILDWWLSPELYLRRPPSKNEQYRLDRMLGAAAQRGVKINIIVYKEVTQALTLSSAHTKHALEKLHPNISVFRHPDHLPDAQTLQSSFRSSLQNFKLTAATASQLPGDALKALYGMGEDTILYWAHHEKLCIVDSHTTFMGGLDLCYGRWDTNQHSISDVHPGDLNKIVFLGQDYNNARIMDFQDVPNWQNNKLDRTTNSRMGWSDLSLSLSGPVVDDLKLHFAERWNFIYNEKYDVRKDVRYSRLVTANQESAPHHHYIPDRLERLENRIENRVEGEWQQFQGSHQSGQDYSRPVEATGHVQCQIMRSCAKWSHGISSEHSIANAYIETIKNSKHFVYIENQFFITATSDKQRPIKNRIGAALVERILRAARANERYKVIIIIPAIPAFAGDLRSDDALSTRAIMEFQYNSINRGGYSIMESIKNEGFDPLEYIRFYNLRNYDRINSSATLREAEAKTGVSYEDARKQHDDIYGAGYGGHGEGTGAHGSNAQLFEQYQDGAQQLGDSGRWDSVASCYMLGGEDIRNVPWKDGDLSEIDAFVSEELYVHTKLLIADDQVVICGSANLNDRSQVGDHDSEIAIFVDDPEPVDSYMNGMPWRASRFAASLRRQLFRKHLGLLRPQDPERPDQNYEPIGVPNVYDWGSPEDQAVVDPLSDDFLNMWNWRAKTNTDAFARVFHPVPFDGVRTWKQYDDYYERFFHEDTKKGEKLSLYKWGHVVAESFSPGEQGLREVKDILSTIKGTLVEMPLLFLKDEDIAKEGLGLNAFTEEVYT